MGRHAVPAFSCPCGAPYRCAQSFPRLLSLPHWSHRIASRSWALVGMGCTSLPVVRLLGSARPTTTAPTHQSSTNNLFTTRIVLLGCGVRPLAQHVAVRNDSRSGRAGPDGACPQAIRQETTFHTCRSTPAAAAAAEEAASPPLHGRERRSCGWGRTWYGIPPASTHAYVPSSFVSPIAREPTPHHAPCTHQDELLRPENEGAGISCTEHGYQPETRIEICITCKQGFIQKHSTGAASRSSSGVQQATLTP